MTGLIIDRIYETEDATVIEVSTPDLTFDTINIEDGHIEVGPLLFSGSSTFTRSNGSISARIYERLTKASRRGGTGYPFTRTVSEAYRRGVYDAMTALQEELT